MSGRVTVYGRDVMKPPLCDSSDAQMVVVRNEAGAPSVLLVRLNGDTWGLTTPDDADWPELCVRFGLLQPKPVSDILSASH